jgi:hypothetical protein
MAARSKLAPTTAADATPRVEVSKLKDGQRTWKVNAVAADTSADALRAAAALALDVDRELDDPKSALRTRSTA